MERQPVKLIPPASQTKANQEEVHGAYFAKVKKEGLEYIPSGCTLLDCVLGGGWPLGRMSNIVGDKSAGKCAVNSATILTDDGFIDLENLQNDFPLGTSENLLKVAVAKGSVDLATHFYKEITHEYISIKTRHGYTIDVTPNHPLLVWTQDCKTVMKRAGSLKIGDVAIIAKATHKYGKDTMPLELAYVLGALVADGINPKHGRIDISTHRQYLKDNLVAALTSLGVKTFCREANVGTGDKNLTKQIFELLGQPDQFTARNKYVPQAVLSGTLAIQVEFLRGLIDCDSWSNNKGLWYYTASEKLSRQVQLMLLNMGIVTSRIPKHGADIKDVHYDHTYWTIGICGKYFNLYADIIGTSKYNFERCAESKSDFDHIPYLLERMIADRQTLKSALGWSANGKLANGSRFPRFNYRAYHHATWHLLNNYIELHAAYQGEHFDLQFYKDLQMSEFHFDPITDLTKTERLSMSYDIHVPDNHKFWCNGFVSHNTLLAIEACCNFNLIYPDGKIIYLEGEAAFDTDYASALGMPINDIEFAGEDLEDYTIESWFDHLTETLNKITKTEQPCLYVVDSLDSLSDKAEKERDITKGTYGAAKPKLIGELFRRLVKDMEQTRLHLMIISQVRDKIGVMFGEKHTRTGGRAMDFYASQILWLAQVKKLEKTILKQTRTYGTMVKAKCKKNKVGLPYRECEFPVVFGYGIDDIAAMITWLESISAKDSILRIINQSSYKSSAALSEELKQVDRQSRIQICNELASEVIDQWELIEQKFLPTTSKY